MIKFSSNKTATATAILLGMTVLAACGGGGGGGGTPGAPTQVTSPPPPPPPSAQAPTWTQGVFEPSATFKDRCQMPRSGNDLRGDPFPDVAGTLLEELFWLRSWSDETYLWNTEIPDQNPAGFNNVLAYFETLKTSAVTPSGRPRDQFHFTQNSEDFLRARLSAPTASYGYNLVAFSTTPPRDYRIRYTEPNSPASNEVGGQANFVRGARILEVDGADLVNATSQADIDILNAGLFPQTAGETHTFVVQDPGAGSTRTVTVTSEDLAVSPVNRTRIINTPTGDVGYILFNTFSPFASEAQIASAMTELSDAGVSDLVLDLRYNGGGLLAVAAQTAYMIAGPARTNGRVFDELVINDNPRNPFRTFDRSTPFYSEGQDFSLAQGTPLDDLNLNRVFILSTSRTCSASEAVINGLRGVNVEVILIGGATCGKPYGFISTDNCGITYSTIQFGSTNDMGFGDYADGFLPNNSSSNIGVRIPGCQVGDDYDNELGDPSEGMLAAALNYRETLACPVVSSSAQTKTAMFKPGMDEVATTDLPEDDLFYILSKDLTKP